MKLYHGTSIRHLADIMAMEAIMPRGKRRGNWRHTIDSHPEMVYLTQVYAGYYAMCAAADEEKLLILEVDSDKLNEQKFYPDEDFIGQVLIHEGKKGLFKTTKDIRNNMHKVRHFWKESLNGMGNVCYRGAIPVTAVSRATIVTFNAFLSPIIDPSITIANYRFCRNKYEVFTKILIGDKLSWDDYRMGDQALLIMPSNHPYVLQAKEKFEKGMQELEIEQISLIK